MPLSFALGQPICPSHRSSLTILSFWNSFIIKSMVDGILMGYYGWAIWEYVTDWDSNDPLFSPRFCGFTSKGSGWAINFASLDLDPNTWSSRLVSFATSFLILSNSFRCWASNWAIFVIYLSFFPVECYRCASMGNLYFNPLNEN